MASLITAHPVSSSTSHGSTMFVAYKAGTRAQVGKEKEAEEEAGASVM
jgi:hypothetical protein